MPGWITHMMIADALLARFARLDRRGFCVGGIAPDCNVENADWSAFEPPRAVTHWMTDDCKRESNADRFWAEHALAHISARTGGEEFAFLLGYYAHLFADGAYYRMIHDPLRSAAAWRRALEAPELSQRAAGLEPTWESVKRLIPKAARLRDTQTFEAEYLRKHPRSGYLTEILPLKAFTDYLDFLPPGAIVRKIGVMGDVPTECENARFIAVSRVEMERYIADTVDALTPRVRARLEAYEALRRGEGGGAK